MTDTPTLTPLEANIIYLRHARNVRQELIAARTMYRQHRVDERARHKEAIENLDALVVKVQQALTTCRADERDFVAVVKRLGGDPDFQDAQPEPLVTDAPKAPAEGVPQ